MIAWDRGKGKEIEFYTLWYDLDKGIDCVGYVVVIWNCYYENLVIGTFVKELLVVWVCFKWLLKC